MIDLQRDGDVFVLKLDGGENRFRPDNLAEISRALDEVEATVGTAGAPAALVTTGSGKFYSNGLDLDWMQGEESERRREYMSSVLGLFGRTLAFPTVTVAAMNGHAFGAGAQWALAHDYRVMREDRGYFCMPEIDMKSPLHPGMTAVIQARLPHQTAHEVIAFGKRYPAEEALQRKIVDEVAPEAEVVKRAVILAASLASKAHPVMTALKRGMYEDALSILEGDAAAKPPRTNPL